jgi:N-methylhydantoinase A/oxoprolinase/acetone carboxylase beta subunit
VSCDIGIDIGGTFTDVVCRMPSGEIRMLKLPTTRADPSQAVLAALDLARARWGIEPAAITRFVHGTTVATNAVLERKGARIGLITTEGFRDVLEIGRQMRHRMYDLALEPEVPAFLAPRRYRKEVRERIDSDGAVLVPLDEQSARDVVQSLAEAGVQAIVVCLLFSFLNAAHERRIGEIVSEIAPGLPVSLSCDVDPAFREYERTVVTAFDGYIKPVVGAYLARMEQGLGAAGVRAPLHVMQSRGGLAGAAVARRRPVRLFLSGPAGGVVGGVEAGKAAGFRDLVTVDIGGTSCDIALISAAAPLIKTEGAIGGFPVRMPMVDVTTIGAGGGSIASLDAAGSLRVGPESAGSDPGPACYGRGGTKATVTDASVALGYIDPANFAGGALQLDLGLAAEAVAREVAEPMGRSLEDAALGIHRVLNAQMAEAIRLISIGRGIDPRNYVLLPFGGGGPMHATALAEELGIRTVVVPPHPGVLAAAGLLGSAVEHEVAAAFPRRIADLDIAALRAGFADLDARCGALMRTEGIAAKDVTVSHFADICYIGQSYFLEVPVALEGSDAVGAIYREFLAAHDRVYGHHTNGPAKLVNLRTVHRSCAGLVPVSARLHVPAAPATRLVRVRQKPERVLAAIWKRDALDAATRIPGPAIIEQADTTTLVEPGWSARLGEGEVLLIERDG